MSRLFSLYAIFLALPLLSRADEPPTETVIRLHVQPMPAPKPALRYQLLPELRDMNPGNPVQGFMMCFTGLGEVFNKNAMAKWKWDKWDDLPLKDLPLEKMRGYGSTIVTQANYAARLDTPDWQVLQKIKTMEDLHHLIAPEVQKTRQLAEVLKWRLRVEVADGKFDEALVTVQTMFVVARTLAEFPSIVADLTGLAITHIAIEPIEEMIAQPGCPNLFWALTDLPHPFIDLRKGLQGERLWFRNLFNKLDDKKPMTESHAQVVLNNFKFPNFPAKKKTSSLVDHINETAQDKKQVQAARRRLIDSGLTEAVVQQFSDLQAILVDKKLIWEKKQDEAIALMSLPFWQAELLRPKSPQSPDDLNTGLIVGGFYTVRQAQARNEQRFALLRCVEALRIHAVEHDGKLPDRLDDIKLPLPVDPITGQSFHYKLEAGIGHLHGTPPPGTEKFSNYNIRYEIAIRK